MIPIGDDNSDRKITPYVNYLLIIVNIVVFVYYQKFGTNLTFLTMYAMVPNEILTGIRDGANASGVPVYATVLTSMFMHGGLGHIIGNMLFLGVFGDNLENRMGHFKYLMFYLICGVLAALSHVLVSAFLGKDMLVPMLGASGAISGVLGGYLLLFPQKKVKLLLFVFVISVPTFIALGLWIAFQLYNGWGALSNVSSQGGIAYAAHIGGFIFGLILVYFFTEKNK